MHKMQHTYILAPTTDSKIDDYRRKQKCIINTQDVVGANLVFLDVVEGFSDSIRDAKVLRSTALYQKCEGREILLKPKKAVEELNTRLTFLGDGAYPQTIWLIKPYPNNIHLNDSQRYFNKSLSSAKF